MNHRRQLTEQTAKGWKATYGIGALLLFAGFPLMALSVGLGTVVATIGCVAFIGGRLGAWWNHG